MRVLHLVGRSHRRGAEVVARELAAELDTRGLSGRILAVGPGHDGAEDEDIPVLTASSRQHPVVLLLAALRLRRELRSMPVDVIVAHGGSAMQAAALATIGSGPPVVHQLIMGMPLEARGRIWRRWISWVVSRAEATVSLTEDLSDQIRSLGYEGPIELIANARSTDRFAGLDRSVSRDRLRSQVGIGPAVPLMGFVGHLVEQKRPDLAIEVLAGVRDRGVDAHLVVTGDGELTGSVRQRVAALEVGDHVTLIGHRDDVEEVLAGLDVFVLTSDDEGMPGIAIEAQMAGTPVVSFPVGGAAEVVGHEETGLVLPSHDVDAMAIAVADLLGDRSRLEAMGSAALIRSQRFSMAAAAARYDEILTEVSSPRS